MKHEIMLQPFRVPNFVRQLAPIGRRENGYIELPAIPLRELSIETLEKMCTQFKLDVFKKAGAHQHTV